MNVPKRLECFIESQKRVVDLELVLDKYPRWGLGTPPPVSGVA